MKKWKLYTSIAVLVIMTCLLGLGIYASISSYNGVTNQTEFVSGDENVFVKIAGTYTGPTPQSANYQLTYNYELTRENSSAFEETPATLPVWYVGKTNFKARTEETLTFVFELTNLNTEYELEVAISGIATDYDNHFSTTYYIYDVGSSDFGNGTKLTPENNNIYSMSIPTFTLGKTEQNNKKAIKVVFELESYAEDFEFENNMKINFASKVEA